LDLSEETTRSVGEAEGLGGVPVTDKEYVIAGLKVMVAESEKDIARWKARIAELEAELDGGR
jgi:hypothetical protein